MVMTLENMFSLMKGRLKFQKVNEELKVPFNITNIFILH